VTAFYDVYTPKSLFDLFARYLVGACLVLSSACLREPTPFTMTSTAASLFEPVLPVGTTGVDLLYLLKIPNSLPAPEHLLLTPSTAEGYHSHQTSLDLSPSSFLES
jgi:hypothetical protein